MAHTKCEVDSHKVVVDLAAVRQVVLSAVDHELEELGRLLSCLRDSHAQNAVFDNHFYLLESVEVNFREPLQKLAAAGEILHALSRARTGKRKIVTLLEKETAHVK